MKNVFKHNAAPYTPYTLYPIQTSKIQAKLQSASIQNTQTKSDC